MKYTVWSKICGHLRRLMLIGHSLRRRAYGDSLDDLPMLELVGSPTAVGQSKDS